MLQFDEKTTAILERAYAGDDFRERRRASFAAVAARPGERILDIGCGTGMLTLDLALSVGPSGEVIGVDPSADMLSQARDRLTGFENVRLDTGTAGQLPVTDAELDAAVSLQVFEYLDDPRAGAKEAARALRSGGRLVIGDMHFGTLSWFSEVPDRMARMCAAWDRHVVDSALPVRLPSVLRSVGLEVTAVTPLTFVDTTLRPDGIARMMLILMERYAVSNGHVSESEARDWVEEQEALARDGRFFFTLTHFVVTARKP